MKNSASLPDLDTMKRDTRAIIDAYLGPERCAALVVKRTDYDCAITMSMLTTDGIHMYMPVGILNDLASPQVFAGLFVSWVLKTDDVARVQSNE